MSDVRGCWLAYYSDKSGMAIFATELEALRYAVGRSMEVCFWDFGVEFSEATR